VKGRRSSDAVAAGNVVLIALPDMLLFDGGVPQEKRSTRSAQRLATQLDRIAQAGADILLREGEHA
jgi:hypothetical protein